MQLIITLIHPLSISNWNNNFVFHKDIFKDCVLIKRNYFCNETHYSTITHFDNNNQKIIHESHVIIMTEYKTSENIVYQFFLPWFAKQRLQRFKIRWCRYALQNVIANFCLILRMNIHPISCDTRIQTASIFCNLLKKHTIWVNELFSKKNWCNFEGIIQKIWQPNSKKKNEYNLLWYFVLQLSHWKLFFNTASFFFWLF